MICVSCRERRHAECPGGNWCDCQHRPPEHAGASPSAASPSAASPAAEPRLSWIRQG